MKPVDYEIQEAAAAFAQGVFPVEANEGRTPTDSAAMAAAAQAWIDAEPQIDDVNSGSFSGEADLAFEAELLVQGVIGPEEMVEELNIAYGEPNSAPVGVSVTLTGQEPFTVSNKATATEAGEEKLFVVFAQSGRESGSAVVKAKTAREANKFARDSDWLTFGRVIPSETIDVAQDLDPEEGYPITQEEHDQYMASMKLGDVVELEWGT